MKDSGLYYKKILYLFSIGACVITSLLLILAMISLITNWFFLIENNWLILIFKLHAGYENVQMNSLELFNLLDALIMFLIFVVSLALYDSLSKNNNIEKGISLIALVLPLLGLIVFFSTGYAGRASVFVWGILFSILMLKYEIYHKITGLVGIVSNSLLFFSDISLLFAASFALITIFGYLLFILYLLSIVSDLYNKYSIEKNDIAF